MSFIDSQGYICIKTKGGVASWGKDASPRNWWLVKNSPNNGKKGVRRIINLGSVFIPESFEGKKVRFKIELMK